MKGVTRVLYQHRVKASGGSEKATSLLRLLNCHPAVLKVTEKNGFLI